jgi:cell division cycle 2-like protein
VQFVEVAADSVTGKLYLVMEFVGPSLHEHQRMRRSPFSEDKTRDMMRQLLQAAQKMHAAGVIHRDVKPANILVSNSGGLKVCDLRLATTKGASAP